MIFMFIYFLITLQYYFYWKTKYWPLHPQVKLCNYHTSPQFSFLSNLLPLLSFYVNRFSNLSDDKVEAKLKCLCVLQAFSARLRKNVVGVTFLISYIMHAFVCLIVRMTGKVEFGVLIVTLYKLEA